MVYRVIYRISWQLFGDNNTRVENISAKYVGNRIDLCKNIWPILIGNCVFNIF